MGVWSMAMTLSTLSVPSTRRCRPGGTREPYTSAMSDRRRISFTSVDLPEPDTPVTQTNWPSGKVTSMSVRLCSRAPRTVMVLSVAGRRTAGTAMDRFPARYCPVMDALLRSSAL